MTYCTTPSFEALTTMCTVVEEYAKEYAKDYAKEKAIETAKLLWEDHVNDNTIVKVTGLSFEELSELKTDLLKQNRGFNWELIH